MKAEDFYVLVTFSLLFWIHLAEKSTAGQIKK